MKILKFERYGNPKDYAGWDDISNVFVEPTKEKNLYSVKIHFKNGKMSSWRATVTKDESGAYTAVNISTKQKLIFR